MNIWLLTSQFPPTVLGGIARYVSNAATMFAAAGHQVTVLAADRVDDDSVLPSGARLVRFAPRQIDLRTLATADLSADHQAFPHNVLSAMPALSYEIAERAAQLARQSPPPDIIEVQDYAALGYFLLQRRLVEDHPLRDTPVVVHMHSPGFTIRAANQEPSYRLPEYWTGQMERFCLVAADALLISSQFLHDRIVRELPTVAGRATVMPLPYAPLTRPAQPPTPGDLVYFGRLQPLKGVAPLADACAALWGQGADFRLTMIGEDTFVPAEGRGMREHLARRHARWIEAGRLTLLPPVSDDELWDRLARAWAVVMPSHWENFPNVVIEAMSLGKLVVASRSGGQRDIIGEGGAAGILFDWEREGDCASALRQALALSPEEVAAIGERARARIGNMTSFASVTPRRIAHFEQVAARGPRRDRQFPQLGTSRPAVPATPDAAARPRISLVVPLTADPTAAAKTIASALASSHPPAEIILATPGAAADEHRRTARQLAHIIGDTPARLLPLSTASCAQAASGLYLAVVPAGWTVAPDMLARAAHALGRYDDVCAVYSWLAQGEPPQRVRPMWNAELPLALLSPMVPAVFVARRSLLAELGGDRPALPDSDQLLWASALEQGYALVSLPDVLSFSAAAPADGLSADDTPQLFRLEQLAERCHASFQRHALAVAGLLNANGPAAGWDHPAAPSLGSPQRYHTLGRRIDRIKSRMRRATALLDATRALVRRRT